MKPLFSPPPLRLNARKGEFTIITDTREQNPLSFPYHSRQETLKTGDYTLDGFKSLITVERKSESDFLASITWERERFFEELKRMLAYPYRALVIESSYGRLAKGAYRSKAKPAAVLATVASIVTRGIPVLFAENHEQASLFVLDFLKQAVTKEAARARTAIAALDLLETTQATCDQLGLAREGLRLP